jgi:catechol 2,3-dioxygenase-like lactoylglutathione lyase family enzyme
MIQTKIGHVQFNVHAENLSFYKALFAFAGWKTWVDAPEMLGVAQDDSTSLWFAGSAKDVSNDYDGPGMNHLALSVSNQGDIDQMAEYLRQHNIPTLFDTPRHRPDFSQDAEHTYYQVMFESPDRILFEVVYIGPLAK